MATRLRASLRRLLGRAAGGQDAYESLEEAFSRPVQAALRYSAAAPRPRIPQPNTSSASAGGPSSGSSWARETAASDGWSNSSVLKGAAALAGLVAAQLSLAASAARADAPGDAAADDARAALMQAYQALEEDVARENARRPVDAKPLRVQPPRFTSAAGGRVEVAIPLPPSADAAALSQAVMDAFSRGGGFGGGSTTARSQRSGASSSLVVESRSSSSGGGGGRGSAAAAVTRAQLLVPAAPSSDNTGVLTFSKSGGAFSPQEVDAIAQLMRRAYLGGDAGAAPRKRGGRSALRHELTRSFDEVLEEMERQLFGGVGFRVIQDLQSALEEIADSMAAADGDGEEEEEEEEAGGFDNDGEGLFGGGDSNGTSNSGSEGPRIFVRPPPSAAGDARWQEEAGGAARSQRRQLGGSGPKHQQQQQQQQSEQRDWGSPAANQAVKQLQSMGAQVFPPGGKESMDWGVLAGYEEQKRQIEDCLLFPLLRPDVYNKVARSTRSTYQTNRPRAVLFEGPPGTGKTTSARVISSQAAVPLVYVPLEAVLSKWYGESEQLLAKVFKAAEALGGAIIFLDELDALGTSRSSDMHEASRRVLSVLLREMEGFDATTRRTVVIGATNRKEDLDAALLSRFDMSVAFGLPNEDCRAAILARYAKQLGDDELRELAARSGGMSGRDLRDVAEHAERRWASKIIRGEADEDSLPPLREYVASIDERLAAIVAAGSAGGAAGSPALIRGRHLFSGLPAPGTSTL